MTKDHMSDVAQPAAMREKIYGILYEQLDLSSEVAIELAECGNLGNVTDAILAALSQPSPAATVETEAVEGELDTIVQLIHKHVGIRQRINVDLTGVEDAAKAILASLHSHSSAGTTDDTDHIDWDVLAEERLGQRPIEHGRHIPQTSPAPGCDSGSHSAVTNEPQTVKEPAERCLTCGRSDAEYKNCDWTCNDPWHADAHLRRSPLTRPHLARGDK